jgi:hypothetical protein
MTLGMAATPAVPLSEQPEPFTMGVQPKPMEKLMNEETPEFGRLAAKLGAEVRIMQEVLGLMLGAAPEETRQLVANRLGSIANLTSANEVQEIAVSAAKQVLSGMQDGLRYGAENASS